MKLNIGCGPGWREMPDDWVHLDLHEYGQQVRGDIRYPLTSWLGRKEAEYDIVVANHVLHMVEWESIDIALANVRATMTPGGVLRIIERDSLRAFQAFERLDEAWFGTIVDPKAGTLSSKLCAWLTWYSTVRTIWTPASMEEAVMRAGFSRVDRAHNPGDTVCDDPTIVELDSRWGESFVVEATK